MRFIKFIIFCVFTFSVSCCKKDLPKIPPAYKAIKDFSEKIEPKTGLVLRSYGVNTWLPKNYQFKKGVANFSMSFSLSKTQQDTISLQNARLLLISMTEDFLH